MKKLIIGFALKILKRVKKLIIGFAIKVLKRKLRDEEFKKQAIAYINSKVDIPGLDEKQERELLEMIPEIIEKFI